MEAAVKPGSEAELAQLVAQAEAPFEMIGTGTQARTWPSGAGGADPRHVGLRGDRRL